MVAVAILDGAEVLALEIVGKWSIGVAQGSESSLCGRWLRRRGTEKRAVGAVPPRKVGCVVWRGRVTGSFPANSRSWKSC